MPYLSVKVETDSLVEAIKSLHNSDIAKAMIELDRQVADVRFTEELIRSLWESLKGDMSAGEQKAFLETLGGDS